MKIFIFESRQGIVALVVVMVVSLFLFSLAFVLSIQGDASIISGQFGVQADRAKTLAYAGLDDAKVKIARIKGYSGSYSITETDGTVAVSISGSVPTIVQVTSTVTRGLWSSQWSLRAEVSLDSDGKVVSIITTHQ